LQRLGIKNRGGINCRLRFKKRFRIRRRKKFFWQQLNVQNFGLYPNNSYFFIVKPANSLFSRTIYESLPNITPTFLFGLPLNLKQAFINFTKLFSLNFSFVQLQIFKFMRVGFLSLVNFKSNKFLIQNVKKFLYFFQALVLFNFKIQKVKFRFRQKALFLFHLKQNLVSTRFGKIIVKLNSNTAFLTISAPGGYTLLQTTSGCLNKKYKLKRFRSASKRGRGYRFRREVRRRMFQKLAKEILKKKGKKKEKTIQMKQLMRRFKGRKRKKLPKGKVKFITNEFIGPLFKFLEVFILRSRNIKSKQELFGYAKIRLKLKLKLKKLKRNNKTKTKMYQLIIAKLKKK